MALTIGIRLDNTFAYSLVCISPNAHIVRMDKDSAGPTLHHVYCSPKMEQRLPLSRDTHFYRNKPILID